MPSIHRQTRAVRRRGCTTRLLEAPADQPPLASRPRQGYAERRLTCLGGCEDSGSLPSLVKSSEVFQARCVLLRGLALPKSTGQLLSSSCSARGAKHGRALTCRRLCQNSTSTGLAEPCSPAFSGSSAAPCRLSLTISFWIKAEVRSSQPQFAAKRSLTPKKPCNRLLQGGPGCQAACRSGVGPGVLLLARQGHCTARLWCEDATSGQA